MENTAVENQINLYQMYDQTVEDFSECGGEIQIIENGKIILRFFNASISKDEEGHEVVYFFDNDERRSWGYQYSAISNIRFYQNTHTLTITL